MKTLNSQAGAFTSDFRPLTWVDGNYLYKKIDVGGFIERWSQSLFQVPEPIVRPQELPQSSLGDDIDAIFAHAAKRRATGTPYRFRDLASRAVSEIAKNGHPTAGWSKEIAAQMTDASD